MTNRGTPKAIQGQATTETIVLLPVYLLFALGLLQMGQLGTALLIANYAASSIARQVVQDGTFNAASAEARFNNVRMAGMTNIQVLHSFSGSKLLSNVSVQACAAVPAFPFVAQLLSRPLAAYSGGCGAPNTMGPFSLNSGRFIVHGKATARMNYRP